MGSRVVELVSRLVEIPSVSDPGRSVLVGRGEALKVMEVLREFSGMRFRMLEGSGAPVLYASIGSGRPVTLFMAHFDVVPPGSGWRVTEPFNPVVKGGRLYGRGAADDKSNVAAITLALDGFEPERGTVVVAFTGDEEIGGARGAGWLAGWMRERGLWPDYLVNGDGSMSSVIVRRRNAFNVKVRVERVVEEVEGSGAVYDLGLEVRGRPTRHAAYFIPGVDRHPVLEAAVIVREAGVIASGLEVEWVKSNVLPPRALLRGVIPGPGKGRVEADVGLTTLLKALIPLTRVTPSGLLYSDYGVTATPNIYNFGSGFHEVVLDVRAMTGDKSVVEESVARALEEVLTLSSFSWEFEVTGGGGYLYTRPSSRIASAALAINAELGLPGEPREAGGASDSRYFSPHGVDAIDYGPLGGNIHGPDEYVVIDHLEKSIEFYGRLAETLHSLPHTP